LVSDFWRHIPTSSWSFAPIWCRKFIFSAGMESTTCSWTWSSRYARFVWRVESAFVALVTTQQMVCSKEPLQYINNWLC